MATPNDDFARNSGDAQENMPALRARVPDNVARGEISTGVIVVTGGTEFLLDFVRNLPRPSAVVARVVMPHTVMPQFIDALAKNVELYRQRYGELPGSIANPQPAHNLPPNSMPGTPNPAPSSTQQHPNASDLHSQVLHAGSNIPEPIQPNPTANTGAGSNDSHSPPNHSANNPQAGAPVPPPKKQSPQEIYDELKLRDEILSGSYANAVMIGHGPYEFSFDFITNFYPQSAVSCRVYLACGHIPRMLDSLKQSWEQLRPRLGYPPPPGFPQ